MTTSERSRLLYYTNTPIVDRDNAHLPGVTRFQKFFAMFGPNVTFIDRNGLLKTPVRTKVWGPMPKLRKMGKSYEEICHERAAEILAHADRLDLPINLLYSGGIDSTLVLISFIKAAKKTQLDRITLLLTQESIAENMPFFQDHIVGKFKVRVAVSYPFLLNRKGILVCGELNDQLMGSDATRALSTKLGSDKIQAKYNRDDIFKLWMLAIDDAPTVNWYLDMFERLKAVAPMPIETNVDFLWWLNFSLKWQSVVFRIASYMSNFNLPAFDKDYFDRYFFAFFGTEDFQLWSMNNMHLKIRDTWESYKFHAKDLIYEFTRDDEYRRTKTKQGSLYWVILHQIQKNFVTEDYKMHMTLPPEHWYEPDNSFLV